ncbi:glycosyltransferase [Paenibacillus contaminans]|nr:glycosyltransferase [Paenibacillus contaminans]
MKRKRSARIHKSKSARRLRRSKRSRPLKRRKRIATKRTPRFAAPPKDEVCELPDTGEDRAPAYDVLRFPVIEWAFGRQRPQQIAAQFAEHGHRVFYFSLDFTAIQNDEAAREDVSERVSFSEIEPNVWQVKLCANKRLNVYCDTLNDPTDLRYMIWSIEHVMKVFDIRQSVSIVDLSFWAPLVQAVGRGSIVYDCMDDHTDFSTNSPDMLEAEMDLLDNADMVVVSSQKLYDFAVQRNDKTVLIRNGVEFDRFHNTRKRLAPELASMTGPVIGYSGAISDWFDIDLIDFLAERNPGWTFVLIGHTFGCDTSKVEKRSNVFLLGELPYAELPGYLHGFDVCLIPFLINNLTMATNPVKVYEYLAAGKPVVAARLPELELLGNKLVRIADEPEQFEKDIRQVMAEHNELEAMRRKRFAAAHSWKDRYLSFHAAVEAYLFPKVSIVIVAFNRWAMTSACLESLLCNTNYPNYEIIVVNNGSTDETESGLAAMRHPRIRTVACDSNAGFSGGNEIGCKAASGEYLVLLNNDTLVPCGWLPRLIKPLKENFEIGLVGPMSNHVGNDQALDFFCGNSIIGADEAWLRDFYRYYRGGVRFTEMLGFFCVAMRKATYLKVGELDKGYGISMFEDDDYCKRVKQAGYRLAIIEDAFVFHHGSASFRNMDQEQYKELWKRNKRYFEQKWNTDWVLPPPPDSIFQQKDDPDSIAEAVRATGRKSVLVIGETDWTPETSHWQAVTESMAVNGKQLVIAYVQTYHGVPLIGIRKIGPSLYMTNRIDLFGKCAFDLVIHRKAADVPEPFKSQAVTLEAIRDGSSRKLDQLRTPSAKAAALPFVL